MASLAIVGFSTAMETGQCVVEPLRRSTVTLERSQTSRSVPKVKGSGRRTRQVCAGVDMIETKISKSATPEELMVVISSSLSYHRWRSIEGCPRVDGLDEMICLQIDLMRWERKNFGLQPSYTSALGIIEELGELEDAQDDEDEWADAIGDTLVFACNLATKNALDFSTMINVAYVAKSAKMDKMLGKLGKLAHVTLKADQGIRDYADRDVARRDIGIVLYRVVSSVVRYASMCGHDVRVIMSRVAREVMRREWWADSRMGVPVFVEGQTVDVVKNEDAEVLDFPATAIIDHTLREGLGKLPTSKDLFEAIFKKFPKLDRIEVITDGNGCHGKDLSVRVGKVGMSIPGISAGIRECMDRIGLNGFSFEVIEGNP